jgi:adenylate cyclase
MPGRNEGPLGSPDRPLWRRLAPGLPGLVALLAMLLLRIVDPGPLEALRLQVFDLYQRLGPRPATDLPIVVVAIDDESLVRIGQWPWPRDRLAAMVDRLRGAGAAVVAFDMVLAGPDRLGALLAAAPLPDALRRGIETALPDPDLLLADALARQRSVTGFALTPEAGGEPPRIAAGFAEIGPASARLDIYRGAVRSLPLFEAEAAGTANLTIGRFPSGTIRRLPLVARLGDRLAPGLAAEILRVAQGAPSILLRAPPPNDLLDSVRIGRLTVPATDDGFLWLSYAREDPSDTVPAWRMLDPGTPDTRLAASFARRIVLIGLTAEGFGDRWATPLGSAMPGVEIHAQAVEQILSGEFLLRPAWATGAEAIATLLGGLWLIVLLLALPPRWRDAGAALLVAALAVASWGLFRERHWLIDPSMPAAALLAAYAATAAALLQATERRRRLLRQAFGRYLAPAMVAALSARPERLRLGGERRTMSFIFTDLAGFTALTETLAPDRQVALINAYLDALCAAVFAHGGTIDKIVGDALHLMFGAPLDQPDHAARAIACALALDDAAEAFAAVQRAEGVAWGATRIGVTTGSVVVGNFGGRDRFDYTAYGAAVNLAARLESANRATGTRLLIAQATYEAAPEAAPLVLIGSLRLKGVAAPVAVWSTPEQAGHGRDPAQVLTVD